MSFYEPPASHLGPPPSRREMGPAVLGAVAVAACGVLLGLVWYLIAPTLPLRKVEGGLAYIGPEPEQPVAADGWFTILGFAFGVLAAVAVWSIARQSRGPTQMIGLTFGAVAAGYAAWMVGTHINTNEYDRAVANAKIGEIVQHPAELASTATRICLPFSDRCATIPAGDIVVPALGGVVGYTLLAGWSRWPDLRREEEPEEPEFFSSGTGPGPIVRG